MIAFECHSSFELLNFLFQFNLPVPINQALGNSSAKLHCIFLVLILMLDLGLDYLDGSCMVYNKQTFLAAVDYHNWRFGDEITHSGDVLNSAFRTDRLKIVSFRVAENDIAFHRKNDRHCRASNSFRTSVC